MSHSFLYAGIEGVLLVSHEYTLVLADPVNGGKLWTGHISMD